MKKHIAVSLTVLALASFSCAQAADVSADIGANTGVQTGPTAGSVGGDAGVHLSTPTGTTGVNSTEPTGVGVASGMAGATGSETDTDVNAPANTMARITAHLSGQGYSNVQRYNDAAASTNNDLAFTATNKAGQKVLVTVDSSTGAVLSERPHP